MSPVEAVPDEKRLESETPGYEVLGSGPSETTGDGWLLRVRIPETSPLFTGHFPGHPILPGVAQLALVTRALGEWQGREIALAGVRSLKLRQPVGPGDTLAVRLSRRADDGSVPFVIQRAGEKEGETVSRGTVLTRGAAVWR
jgi:3-hydroxymyristoyl/3-hydroxydecanoyl-(acyl carrier protein) dehydratase